MIINNLKKSRRFLIKSKIMSCCFKQIAENIIYLFLFALLQLEMFLLYGKNVLKYNFTKKEQII